MSCIRAGDDRCNSTMGGAGDHGMLGVLVLWYWSLHDDGSNDTMESVGAGQYVSNRGMRSVMMVLCMGSIGRHRMISVLMSILHVLY